MFSNSDSYDLAAEKVDNAIDNTVSNERIIKQVLIKVADDPGAPFEAEAITALAAIKQDNPAQYLRHRQAFKKANHDVLLMELDKLVRMKCGGNSDESESIADILVSLTKERADLFTDSNNDPYASFSHEQHTETWALDSTGFREWVSYAFYSEYGKAPRDASLKDALNTLSGVATHEGENLDVYLRCAPYLDGYIIDLCDETWRVIEVTPGRWRVLNESPVKFKRTPTMKPLPVPESGGKVSCLWEFLNISEENRGLVIAWLLEAYRPETPFPVLEIGGEQGSAKSTTQKYLRDFIDPSAINLRAAPKTEEDIFVSAARNWLASYNNLSHLSATRQDALCTLATGGGYGGRKLFTNNEESVWESKRPVVINGISTLVTAPDLLDRTIRTESPKIENYISEAELQTKFDQKQAGIYGALLDIFVEALAILPRVEIVKPPRMTDFAHFGEAVYQAIGKEPGDFLEDYKKGRKVAVLQSIESSPVANAVIEMMQKTDFKGTVGELLNRLDEYKPKGDTGWPKSPKGLSDALKRYAPSLRLIGTQVNFGNRSNQGRIVHIYQPPVCIESTDSNSTTVTTVTERAESDAGDVRDGEIPLFNNPSRQYTCPNDMEAF